MRKIEEIVKYIRENRDEDLFNTLDDIILYLPYEYAKEFLLDTVTKEKWKSVQIEMTKDSVVKEITDYMSFALGKAENHRGLSAGRSIEHFRGWLCVLGDDELLAFIDEDDNYAMYGCPILKKICDKYGIEYPTNQEMVNMSNGKLCHPDCSG